VIFESEEIGQRFDNIDPVQFFRRYVAEENGWGRPMKAGREESRTESLSRVRGILAGFPAWLVSSLFLAQGIRSTIASQKPSNRSATCCYCGCGYQLKFSL